MSLSMPKSDVANIARGGTFGMRAHIVASPSDMIWMTKHWRTIWSGIKHVPLAAGMIAHQQDQDQDNQATAPGHHSDEDKSKT